MTETTKSKYKKSWARETAFALLVFLCVLAWEGKVQELTILVLPFTTFAFVAFGYKNVENIVPMVTPKPTGPK